MASGNGASKSAATAIRPLSWPGRRGWLRAAIGTRRAMGRPALAMMISSPAAARSTSCDRLVLAS